MKRLRFTFALVLSGTLIAGVQFSGANLVMAGAASSEKQYLMTHQEADPRFLTSIERVGACKVATRPEMGGIRVPWQIYPKESVDKHEEGTVTLELILDPDWCVRKATIVQSTGYWRLDNVTLAYVMTVKYMPKPETIKEKDGEPTVTVKLGWGASQGKK